MNESLKRRIENLEKEKGIQLDIGAEFHRDLCRLFGEDGEDLSEEEWSQEEEAFEAKLEIWRKAAQKKG